MFNNRPSMKERIKRIIKAAVIALVLMFVVSQLLPDSYYLCRAPMTETEFPACLASHDNAQFFIRVWENENGDMVVQDIFDKYKQQTEPGIVAQITIRNGRVTDVVIDSNSVSTSLNLELSKLEYR